MTASARARHTLRRMPELCEFCGREPTDRFRPLDRSTLEIVDCERCGAFAIGSAVSTLVLALWTNEQRAEERARIERSNRSGFIHHVGRSDAIVDGWGLLPR